MQTSQRTTEQNLVASSLAKQYGIPKDRVFFLDPSDPKKPWLAADELTAIARQSDRFQAIEARFDCFIPELKQIVHSASVTDRDGRVFSRVGVATLGEKMPGGTEANEHGLADTRALVATLSAAGFNPLRGSVGSDTPKPVITMVEADDERLSQLRQIHKLAEKVGLIVKTDQGRDDKRYRDWLRENFDTDSVSGLDYAGRASVIALLNLEEKELESL